MSDALIGQKLPHVVLPSSEGGSVNIPRDFEGSWTLLYFYPKDDTPGCTKQACSYRDNIDAFTNKGAKVYGVSLDDLTSHGDFREKYHLNFPLLADTGHKLGEALGVYTPGSLFSRDTFLVDKTGTIRVVWRQVKATETMAETLLKLEELA